MHNIDLPAYIEAENDKFTSIANATLTQLRDALKIESDPSRKKSIQRLVALGEKHGINPHVPFLHALDAVSQHTL